MNCKIRESHREKLRKRHFQILIVSNSIVSFLHRELLIIGGGAAKEQIDALNRGVRCHRETKYEFLCDGSTAAHLHIQIPPVGYAVPLRLLLIGVPFRVHCGYRDGVLY